MNEILLFLRARFASLQQGDQIGRFVSSWAIVYIRQFLENNKMAQIFSYIFTWQKLCINFDETVLGYTLGDCFTNSSGHPASQPQGKKSDLLCTYLPKLHRFARFFLAQHTKKGMKISVN
jgi:hypothetical protein